MLWIEEVFEGGLRHMQCCDIEYTEDKLLNTFFLFPSLTYHVSPVILDRSMHKWMKQTTFLFSTAPLTLPSQFLCV